MTAVYISSYTAVTGCGLGNESLLNALLKQQSCLKPAQLIQPDFMMYTGEISVPLPVIQDSLKAFDTRNARIALAALNCEGEGFRKAVALAVQRYGASRVGVIIGTSTSGIYETELSYQQHHTSGSTADHFDLQHQHVWVATADFLKHELQLTGPSYGISTACSSSGKAIAAGQRMIASDICDAVVVGGVDSMCHLTVHGFHSLELTSEQPCKPLDQHRNGISLGEAAGLLLLDKSCSDVSALCLLGCGESSDAYHMTAPHPEGEGAKKAMRLALEQASLRPHDMSYINLHATGTRMNDRSEMRAMALLFGNQVACSATKGITGHTLGASGAIEAIISLMALEHQFLPGTCGLDEVDEAFTTCIIKEPLRHQKVSYVMSNNFGFGGNNVSLIFSKRESLEANHG